MKLSNSVQKLETLFDEVNNHLFEGEVIRPVITIQTNGRRSSTLGWCTTWKAWKDGEKVGTNDGYYEINICSEYLHRPFFEVMGTLIHEMVHLYNLQNGIQDCSRSGTYHNKRFKRAAEKYGLTVYRQNGRGFASTKLNIATAKWVETRYAGISFNLHRGNFDVNAGSGESENEPGKTKQSFRKYVCPECNTIVRATKQVNIVCGDCDQNFINQR